MFLFVSDTRQASNFNSLYVAATRGRHDLSIYTNDQEQLKDQVQIEQNKTSNLDYEIPSASLNQDLSPTLEIQPQFKSDELQPAA